MQIRRLDVTHTLHYRNLMLQGFRDHPDAFTSTYAERKDMPPQWWQARLGVTGEQSLVVGAFEDDGTLVGIAGLEFNTREKTRHVAVLFGMHVAPAQRGRGLGRRLVEGILDCARDRDQVTVVRLTVSEGNSAAESLYSRCGFVDFGFEPRAIRAESGYLGKRHMWVGI